MSRHSPLLRLLLLLALIPIPVGSAKAASSPRPHAESSPHQASSPNGRYIVVLRDDGFSAADVSEAVAESPGVEVTQVYSYALTGFAAELTSGALATLENDPRVAQIVPDGKVVPFAQTIPNGVKRIEADKNPTAKIDSVDDRVDADIAILDMGIGPHPDLNVVGGYDCTGEGFITDNGGHGTHVAGIAAALDNGFGTVGVAPGARLWSVRVLDANDGSWSWVLCGIDWVTQHADVIDVANMSLGESLGSANAPYEPLVHAALQRSIAAGVTYVVAAGNGDEDARNVIPARYPEVITVSAMGDSDGKPGGFGPDLSDSVDDGLADFSDFGPAVDIAAPGVHTRSTALGGGYGYMSGTSFATPHVVGAVALYIAEHGRVGPDAVRTALLAAAEPGPISDDSDGYPEGVLNVRRIAGGDLELGATTGKVGDIVSVALIGFAGAQSVDLAWDHVVIKSVQTDSDGNATATIKVPSSTYGNHLVAAQSDEATDAVTFKVLSSVRAYTEPVKVGDQVKIVLRGFGHREDVDIFWKNGTTNAYVSTIRVSSLGTVSFLFTVPPALRGAHTLRAVGETGTSASTTMTVVPSVAVSPVAADAGGRVLVTIRGFKSREVLHLQLDDGGEITPVLDTVASTATGSRKFYVDLPIDATVGTQMFEIVGGGGSSASTPFDITGPALASLEEASLTATATPESATSTAAASATPTLMPTPEPTATETPSATPTLLPTPQPTATETVPPAATPTPEPTASTPAVLAIRRGSHSAGSDSSRIIYDRDASTAWFSGSSNVAEPYVQIELEETAPIAAIRWLLSPEAPVGSFMIEVSTDRLDWTTIAEISNGVPGEWRSVETGGVIVRYVRFVFAASDDRSPVGGLAEVELLPA